MVARKKQMQLTRLGALILGPRTARLIVVVMAVSQEKQPDERGGKGVAVWSSDGSWRGMGGLVLS